MTRTEASVALLDVNVLVALAWPNHVHHAPAHRWFERQAAWATCPLTQSAFIRLSSNPRVVGDAGPAPMPAQALGVLQRMLALPGHEFWADDRSFGAVADGAQTDGFGTLQVVGYRQVTDAHMLGLAMARGGAVATFDRGVLELLPAALRNEGHVVLLEAPV